VGEHARLRPAFGRDKREGGFHRHAGDGRAKVVAKAKLNKVAINTIMFSDYGLDLYSIAMISSNKIIQENPDQLRRLVEASWRGVSFAVENPGRAAQDLIKNRGALDEKTEREVWRIVVNHLLTPYQRTHGLGQMSAEKAR